MRLMAVLTWSWELLLGALAMAAVRLRARAVACCCSVGDFERVLGLGSERHRL